MKQFFILIKLALNKEKIFIILGIFGLLVISMHYTYSQSVFSSGYMSYYKDAPLEFFYYIQLTGVNPFVLMILMILLPNLVSYHLLDMHQNQTTYFIETRIGKKKYYLETFICNILFTFITIFIIEVGLLLVIHLFYGKVVFLSQNYPEGYYPLTQTICHNELINLILFLNLTSLGYALLSSVLFSLQVFISHKYIYRCLGVVFAIALIVVPILVMNYFPIKDLSVLFQITPLIAVGVEQVRDNPFGLSNILHYFATFSIYTIISFVLYKILYDWRKYND